MRDSKEHPNIRFTSGYTDEALPFAQKNTGSEQPAASRSLRTASSAQDHARSERSVPSSDVHNVSFAIQQDPNAALPETLRHLRSVSSAALHFPAGKNRQFYEQAKLAEWYEDDYECKSRFSRYFPTYQSMNNDQLRGYFSFRTKLRRHLSELRKTVKVLVSEAAESSPDSFPADETLGAAFDETAVALSAPENIRKAVAACVTQRDTTNPEKNLSYLYLYAYELIHGIGTKTAEDGYFLLYSLLILYGSDAIFVGHLKRWLGDYAVYYNLDRRFALPFFETERDDAIDTLSRFEKRLISEDAPSVSSKAAYQAILELSGVNMTRSLSRQKHEEDFRGALLLAYQKVCLFYIESGRPMILEQSFGGLGLYPYRMFDSAVFYDYLHREDYTYVIDRLHTFRCRNGSWQCEKYLMADQKSRLIGQICQETDRILRLRLHIGKPLKKRMQSTILSTLIEQAVDEYFSKKQEAMRPRIEINPEHLFAIRRDAAETREKLITKEELGEQNLSDTMLNLPPGAEGTLSEAESRTLRAQNAEELHLPRQTIAKPGQPQTMAEAAQPQTTAEAEQPQPAAESHPSLLTEAQKTFLRLLLEGGDWKRFLADQSATAALMIDSVNEALYDEIGDTVLDTSDGSPSIIEDYKDDVLNLLK
jgi:hypothetical protein